MSLYQTEVENLIKKGENSKLLAVYESLLEKICARNDFLKFGELFERVGPKPENLNRDYFAESFVPSSFKCLYGNFNAIR